MDDDYPVDAPLDTVMILIAELMRAGVLHDEQVTNIVRRLKMSELPDVAARVENLHFSNEMDTPSSNRKTIHLVHSTLDGGNGTD